MTGRVIDRSGQLTGEQEKLIQAFQEKARIELTQLFRDGTIMSVAVRVQRIGQRQEFTAPRVVIER